MPSETFVLIYNGMMFACLLTGIIGLIWLQGRR